MTFQPFLAATAVLTMCATSSPSARSSEIHTDRENSPAKARRSAGRGAQFEDTRVGFTRIRECFTLSVFDIQQPYLRSRLAKTQPSALAIMKHMRSFMDDEVRKPVVLVEILWRDVACGVLAEADKLRSVVA